MHTRVLFIGGLLPIILLECQVVVCSAQQSEPARAVQERMVVDAGVAYARSEVVQVVTDHVPRAVGGWIGVGSHKLRLQADYWHRHTRGGFAGNVGGIYYETTSSAITQELDLTVMRHFRPGRWLRPHWLAGAGYLWSHGVACEKEGIAAAFDCDEWVDSRVAGVTGAGLDVSLSTAFFLRVQSRWYVLSGVGLPLPVFAVGVGVGGR